MKSISVFNFTFQNAGNKTCDVFIDGLIVDESTRQLYEDWFGDTTSVSYKSIRMELKAAIADGAKIVNVYVNCAGGNVIEAMALHDYFIELENKGITINKIGRGMIASAATYFVSGKNSSITKNSWYMIHNVSGGVWGDVNDVENYAKTLRDFNNNIANFYVNNTGMSIDTINDMMNAETWMDGETAARLKFVNECTPETNFTNSIDPEKWMFKNTQVLNAYNSFTNKNPIMEKTTISNIINGVKDAFMNALKEAGIVKDENTKLCETLTNALDTALAPMNTGITDMVNEAVDERLGKLTETVNNAVAAAIEALPKPEAIDTAAIENRFTEIETKLADEAGSAAGEKDKDIKVDATNHKGITFE